VLILVLAVVSWIERRRLPVSPCLAAGHPGVGVPAGGFGALTVTMKLFPAIVTLHLLGGLVLLALLRAQAVRYDAGPPAPCAGRDVARHPAGAAGLVFALLWLQIALGGWVSTNYAVLACATFPPARAAGGRHGPSRRLHLWRELGLNAAGEPSPFRRAHRHPLRAPAVCLCGACWCWGGWPGALARAREPDRRALAARLLAAWQLLTGLSNVVLDWPLLAAVAHTGGAAALVIVLTGASLAAAAPPTASRAAPPSRFPT
jgi:heme a synthase